MPEQKDKLSFIRHRTHPSAYSHKCTPDVRVSVSAAASVFATSQREVRRHSAYIFSITSLKFLYITGRLSFSVFVSSPDSIEK